MSLAVIVLTVNILHYSHCTGLLSCVFVKYLKIGNVSSTFNMRNNDDERASLDILADFYHIIFNRNIILSM